MPCTAGAVLDDYRELDLVHLLAQTVIGGSYELRGKQKSARHGPSMAMPT